MTQVNFNGKTYTLTQDAYYSNGNEEEYMAGAVDELYIDNFRADIACQGEWE